MELGEFIFQKEKNKRLQKSLSKLNEQRKRIKGKEDYCDDGIQPDCKCEWKGDCEDLCKHGLK